MPHVYVQRTVTLLADATTVRLVDGLTTIARHLRSFGTNDVVEDAAHLDALRAAKTAAGHVTSRDRVMQAVPLSAQLFDQLAQRGDNLAVASRRVRALLEDYGPEELHAAIEDALAHLLEQRRRRRGRKPPMPIALPDRPEVRDLDVRRHDLETYDALTRPDPVDPDQ